MSMRPYTYRRIHYRWYALTCKSGEIYMNAILLEMSDSEDVFTPTRNHIPHSDSDSSIESMASAASNSETGSPKPHRVGPIILHVA